MTGHSVLYFDGGKWNTEDAVGYDKKVIDVTVCLGVHALYDIAVVNNHNFLVYNEDSKDYLLSSNCKPEMVAV